MNNKPTCHPEKPESGQQTITLEHRRNLTEVTRYAHTMNQPTSKPPVDNSPHATPAMNTINPESIHISKLRKMAWDMENVGFA